MRVGNAIEMIDFGAPYYVARMPSTPALDWPSHWPSPCSGVPPAGAAPNWTMPGTEVSFPVPTRVRRSEASTSVDETAQGTYSALW